MQYLLIIYGLFFLLLAFKNFRLATGLFIFALPSYLIRFNIGPLPTTLLELNFGILFVVWLIKYARADWLIIKEQISRNKFLFFCFFAFLLSSVIGIFVSDMWYYSLGQWRAYFLEPMLLFLVLVGRLPPVIPNPPRGGEESLSQQDNRQRSLAVARDDKMTLADLVWPLLFSGALVATVAIIQFSTGALYPPSLWDDELRGRATSFFTSPNAVGLFLGPIFFLGLYAWRSAKIKPEKLMAISLTGLILLGLLASQSLGTLIAVTIGLLVWMLVEVKQKIVLKATVIIAVLLLVPCFLFLANKTKSFENRLTLWSHTKTFLTESPKNFIFGAGIRQYFRKVEKPFYNPVELERLIYPHNVFLNFWTEIGLVGMLSFVGIFAYLLLTTYYLLPTNRLLGASLLAVLTVIIVHGLVDVPYFKNDLAMLFWIIATIIVNEAPISKSEILNKSKIQIS